MLTKHRSKKQAESGEWVEDSAADACMICSAKFTLTKRRHHCRKCGKLVCGDCSASRIHLDTSRSGGAKRVCNTCHDAILAEEDAEVKARESVRSLSLEAAGGSEASEAASAADDTAGVSAPITEPEGPRAPVAPPKKPQMPLPEVTGAESATALSTFSLEGEWTGVFQFLVVDIGPQRKDSNRHLLAVQGQRRSSITGASGHVRDGSKLRVTFSLVMKGSSYLTGVLPAFGQFGRDGKVTGSIQKLSGKISLQFQIASFGVTTSFNLNGLLSKDGELVGQFSGCEMTKVSGTVSGVFRAAKSATTDASDGSDHDTESAAASAPEGAVGDA